MINNINRGNVKEIRSIIEKALTNALAEHGLTASLGNIRFTPASLSVKLSVMTTTTLGVPNTPERMELLNHGGLYGLPEGVTAGSHIGGGFTLLGVNPKAHKYPFFAERKGKRYKMSLAQVKMYLSQL